MTATTEHGIFPSSFSKKGTAAHSNSRVGILVFQDSSFLAAEGMGAAKQVLGELVFNTSMTGYQEALTDPSYAGQILTFCQPLIGNYGFSPECLESEKIFASAAIVREECEKPFFAPLHAQTLGEFLSAHGTPGLTGLDTRSIVLRIREHGVLPAALQVFEEGELRNGADDAKQAAQEIAAKINSFDYSGQNYVAQASPKAMRKFGNPDAKKHVVLVDCGAKKSIISRLLSQGARVTAVPWNATAKEIIALEPGGVMYSNGPGDPAMLGEAIESCRGVLGKVPVFGICLGNQILGHALGAKTFKLKFGHRGSNHPVIHADSGRVFITAQNHGYAVKGLPRGVEPLFENAYDSTNEGLKCVEQQAFSVQFHPEANPGPHDTSFLFDEFIEML